MSWCLVTRVETISVEKLSERSCLVRFRSEYIARQACERRKELGKYIEVLIAAFYKP
jgi:hypothetical protein